MEIFSPIDLVAELRQPHLRIRTGIWLIPLDLVGQEADEAARLGIAAVDLRDELLTSLPPGTVYAPLDTERVLQLLDALTKDRQLQGGCVLVYNLDLLLARLTHQQRIDFWQFAYQGFAHRPIALLLVMPETASSILPVGEVLSHWIQGGRLIPSFLSDSTPTSNFQP